MIKKFDLNIEKILENWTISLAIREIIANALDEHVLTEKKKKEIDIFQVSKNKWCVRDYGRGLNIEHFTQKENDEKLSHQNLIGQFGIGLKDALATFWRKNIDIKIKSKYLIIDRLEMSKKEGFDNIHTLHVLVKENDDKNFEGTEFILDGVKEQEIIDAKNLFLNFLNLRILESNKYGEIIKKEEEESSSIFLNGIKVAEEPDFLFSYNITSLDKKIKKAINRERTNVGRVAYSDRIKSILTNSSNEEILELLGNELQNIERGTACYEISNWIDVQEHIIKYLSPKGFRFITAREAMRQDVVNEIQISRKIIIIPEKLKYKIADEIDIEGNRIGTFETFIEESNENFQFKFIDPSKLNKEELLIFNRTNEIISLIGDRPNNVKEIKISETMQKDVRNFMPLYGIWQSENNRIIIKKSELRNLKSYAGTLLHEISHAKSDARDETREFENQLTDIIGILVNKLL